MRHLIIVSMIVGCLWLNLGLPAAVAAGDRTVYQDALASDWANWSWNTTANFGNASPVHAGSAALAVTYNGGWAGFYLHTDTFAPSGQYDLLRFYVHGGTTGGQELHLVLYDEAMQPADLSVNIQPRANTWDLIEVSMAELGSPAEISGIVWQDASGHAQNTFYLDEIALVAPLVPPTPTPTPAPAAGPALTVNAGAARHLISPDIYGINFAAEGLAADLRLPVRRWGGNSTTRYNWQNDTANHASDWFFENIPEENPDPSTLPNGSTVDRFVEQDRRTSTRTIVTLPLIGWTPKSRDYACGFSVSKYGAQQATDSWRPDCGNGRNTDGSTMTGNDPTDTSLAVTPSFIQDWIAHLISRFGTAAQGGVAFYNLDNEPMLWNSTHRDVHPQPASYDEVRDLTYQYAAAIKAADPTAQTLGPVLWGWTAYFYSALDAAAGGSWWNKSPDRNAHGGVPFVDWYLQQMQDYEQAHGTRIVDYLDLHYYPQATGVALSPAGNATTQALRLRSTRALWDATYSDESWIAEPVRLIPRMRDWVAQNYPGTKLAITEYNWGALDHINGALAQGDVLGIFGREGLDLATLWAPPDATKPGAFAFRMYRNVDGNGQSFGETSVSAVSANEEQLAIYAALRQGDSALTLMVVNKSSRDLISAVTLAGFSSASQAAVYRYSAANLGAIVREADQVVSAGGFSALFPRDSITLLALPPSGPPCYDFDADGRVTFADAQIVAGYWHEPPRYVAAYDIVPDGVINVADVMTVSAHIGDVCGGG
jgi:hypothetical protein